MISILSMRFNFILKTGSAMALPPTLYPLAKEDGYHPHCDIDYEEGCNLKHSFPEIIVTHVLISKSIQEIMVGNGLELLAFVVYIQES
ncbi:hypothetical protein Tco_0912791 [Tanacetum coccineum]